MDYQFIDLFFTSYSLPTLIIALSVAIISIIADLIFKGKLPFFITNYVPFILSLVLYFIYDTTFVFNAFILSEDTFISGILSGSLSLIFTRTYYSIIRGKTLKSPTVTVIEELIKGVVKDDLLYTTALSVESLITSENNHSDNETVVLIAEIIKENSLEEKDDGDLFAVATLIFNAVSVL